VFVAKGLIAVDIVFQRIHIQQDGGGDQFVFFHGNFLLAVNEKGVSIVFVSQTNALVKGMFFVYHISIIEIEKR